MRDLNTLQTANVTRPLKLSCTTPNTMDAGALQPIHAGLRRLDGQPFNSQLFWWFRQRARVDFDNGPLQLTNGSGFLGIDGRTKLDIDLHAYRVRPGQGHSFKLAWYELCAFLLLFLHQCIYYLYRKMSIPFCSHNW